MFSVLLGLSSLHLLTGAAVVQHTGKTTLDLSACPFKYYGKEYRSLVVDFVDNNQIFCFDVDCIKTGPVLTQNFASNMNPDVASVTASVQNLIRAITTAPVCALSISAKYSSSGFSYIYFLNFGTRFVMFFVLNVDPKPLITFRLLVKGIMKQEFGYVSAGSQKVLADVSSCRFNDEILVNGLSATEPNTCNVFECSNYVLTPKGSKCKLGAICLGSGACGYKNFCSITGPSFIDTRGQTGVVPGGCEYSLFEAAGISISGQFTQRRLTDVFFLDKVKINLYNVVVTIDHRGQLYSSGKEVDLSTPKKFSALTYYKNDSGIIGSFKSEPYAIDIFIDGTTAQASIITAVPLTSGLCYNATADLRMYKSVKSKAGCDTVTPDPKWAITNCAEAAARCSILKEKEPFLSCNARVDPTPYIQSCRETLCNYPDVDGVYCQFLQAYARTCQLKDWRTSAGCPKATCVYNNCPDSMFCGVSVDEKAICLCRASYKNSFDYLSSNGPPTDCSDKTASVTFDECFLSQEGINYRELHLNDQSCKGVWNPRDNTVVFSFNDTRSCGAVVTSDGSRIIYKNMIKSNNFTGIISRQEGVNLEFSCAYEQPNIKSMAIKIMENSVVHVFNRGLWPFTLMMKAFTNSGFTAAVDSQTSLHLDQRIWIKLEAVGVDRQKLVLQMDSCWATKNPASDATQKYTLITKGCANPVDKTVRVLSNGVTLSGSFSFNMFQFVGHTGNIYLHCKVNLCIKPGNNCIPQCGNRRRRSVSTHVNEPALITMGWKN